MQLLFQQTRTMFVVKIFSITFSCDEKVIQKITPLSGVNPLCTIEESSWKSRTSPFSVDSLDGSFTPERARHFDYPNARDIKFHWFLEKD